MKVRRCLLLALISTSLFSVKDVYSQVRVDSPQRATPGTLLSAPPIVKINSKKNPELIPASVYYRKIFKDLLNNPTSLAGLPDADVATIQNLPSHRDRRFDAKNFDQIMGVCRGVNAINRLNDFSSQIVSLAMKFEESRQSGERDLAEHYNEKLRNFSTDTRNFVEAKKEELFATADINYAYLDIVTLAKTFPEQALKAFEAKCSSMTAYRGAIPLGNYKLQDDETEIVPLIAN